MDGSPLHDIRIEVHSLATGAILQVSNSGLNGTFMVSNLRPGNYEVVAVDGLSETRQVVSLQSESATVSLRLSKASSAPKRGTISVASLKIPEKAQRLIEKSAQFPGEESLRRCKEEY
jgi:uncharacterized surface anchored protein